MWAERLGERLEEIPVWKGEHMEPIQITPAKRRIIFNQNLLVQFLYLDNAPLFLAIKTADNELDLEGLRSLLTSSGYLLDPEETEETLSSALDTLLDFGIFKAMWKPFDGEYRRVFVNRNELFDMFAGFQEKLTQKLSEMNFSGTAESLRDKIHIGESPALTFEDGYYIKRMEGTEKELVKFIEECLLRPDVYDVLVPLARKGWVLFDHLKNEGKLEITVPYEYGINPKRLKNKRICLFDDAVKQGKHLYDALDQLVKAGIPPESITLITFLLNETTYFDSKNEYRAKIRNSLGRDIVSYRSLNDLDFHRKVADIVMYIAHFGTIIDPDHLVVTIKLTKPLSGKSVMGILNDLGIGKVLEPGVDLQHLYPNKKKITIDKIDYRAITGEAFPEIVHRIMQCKFRMIWEYDLKFQTQRFELTPIVNPVIDKKGSKTECEHAPSLGFCQKFLSSTPTENGGPCVDCVLFSMITKLLKAFLEVLAKRMPTGIGMHIESMRWVEFESDYTDDLAVMNEWDKFKDDLLQKYT